LQPNFIEFPNGGREVQKDGSIASCRTLSIAPGSVYSFPRLLRPNGKATAKYKGGEPKTLHHDLRGLVNSCKELAFNKFRAD